MYRDGAFIVEFHVDRTTGLPAYLQLAQQVREALRLGWLKPGDRLPTVREAVASSGVNPNTVVKAYRELEFAGLVEARQGAGTFVRDTVESMASQESEELLAALAPWIQRARAAGLTDEDIHALVRAALTNRNREEIR